MCARQACGVHGHGEDQAGAAGQLHLVRQKEEAVQRQIFGQAQCRYAKITHACAHKHAVEKNVLFVRMLSIFFTALVSTCAGYWTVHPQQGCPTVFLTEEPHFKQPTPMRSTPKKKKKPFAKYLEHPQNPQEKRASVHNRHVKPPRAITMDFT